MAAGEGMLRSICELQGQRTENWGPCPNIKVMVNVGPLGAWAWRVRNLQCTALAAQLSARAQVSGGTRMQHRTRASLTFYSRYFVYYQFYEYV